MYKNFQKSTNNRSFKYSFVASFCIMALVFTFINNTAYGATTTTVTEIGNNEFTEPTGLAVDSSCDNIYVAEDSGIKKIDISSNTTTTAAVSFTDSYVVALDSDDNIYVLDSSSDNIYKTNNDGNTTTLAMSDKGVIHPSGIALDSSDNIYIIDAGDNRIKKFDSYGIPIGNPIGLYNAYSIYEIAVDNTGNIYAKCFTNDSKYVINKFHSDGTFIATIISGDNNSNNMHIAMDSSNNVYISNYDTENSKNTIYKINTDGQAEVYASYEPEYDINGIAVDNNGNIYVLEGNYIKKITVLPELKIDTANAPNATVGTAYSYQFTSTGGIGEKTYTVTDPNNLPAGLTLSENGTLSGIPTVVGTSQFTVIATDSATPIASKSSATVNLTVNPAAPINVLLAPNSLGIAGNAKITGLTTGNKYKIMVDGVTKYVKADRTLSDLESEVGNLIGTEITGLTNGSTYNVEVYTPPTTGGSSSGSGSGSSNSGSSSGVVQLMATVTNGQFQYTVPFEITTETDGTKKGKLEIKEKNAKEIVDSLNKKGEDTARINIPDTKGELSSLTANIPTAAIATFANSGKNLELETPNGGVTLSNQNMRNIVNTSNQQLYFTFTPINDAMTQTEIDIKAVKLQIEQLQRELQQQPKQQVQILQIIQLQQLQQQQLLLQQQLQQQIQQPTRPTNGIINETKERKSELLGLSKDDSIGLGRSVDISSNIPPGESIGVNLPITSKRPSSSALEAEILNNLGVYIEHSNGEKVIQNFDKVRFQAGGPIGTVNVRHLSNFTIIRLSQRGTDVGNWQNDEQGWKYISNGELATGWNQIGGSWYLMNLEGIMQTGWQQTNGNWYFLKYNGAMATGWMQSNGIWYLLNNNGAMETDWQQVNDAWYYLYSDGAMAIDTVIDGYKLDQNGSWVD